MRAVNRGICARFMALMEPRVKKARDHHGYPVAPRADPLRAQINIYKAINKSDRL